MKNKKSIISDSQKRHGANTRSTMPTKFHHLLTRLIQIFHTCLNWIKSGPDALLKWAQLIALIFAGIWAFYQFDIGGGNDWMVNLDMTTEVLPYHDDLRLLVVHVKSKNPRNTRIEFNKPSGSFTVTVRNIPDGLKEGITFNETSGKLIATADLLIDNGYLFLPYSEFDDMAAFVLPQGKIFSIAAELANATDRVTANKIIKLDLPK